jgi:peptidoglycan/LPS O-acetylase OafA/YrhL
VRNKRLDILRCVAVLVVLFHHWTFSHFFQMWGWVGVDLFFVLSGFLISGLLFSEYKKRQDISFKRFFVRRALKIYPAFYLFLLVTAGADRLILHHAMPPVLYLNEAFFVMNYLGGAYAHTWSLGVEEHFYILLPLFLLLTIRRSPDRDDPFRRLPLACLFVGIFCIVTRAISAGGASPNYDALYQATHNRIDALSFGVLLGYLHHFRPRILERLLAPTANRISIGLVSVLLLSSAYYLRRESALFSILGFTFVYLGWAGIFLLCLHVRNVLPRFAAGAAARVGSAFAYVGMFSYSIYLWQGTAETWLPRVLNLGVLSPSVRLVIFLAGDLAVGIAMSKLIEYPVLRLRDRFFPAIERSPAGSGGEVYALPPLEERAAV